MKRYFFCSLCILALSGCTFGSPSTPTNTPPASGEIPQNAKILTGYQYPSVPLSEFQAGQNTGSNQ